MNIFHPKQRTDQNPQSPAGESNEICVRVNGGYEPSTIRVPAVGATRIIFNREDASECSEQVVFADFGVKRYLPRGENVAVELPINRPGTYAFTCGMGMLRGTLVVSAADDHSAPANEREQS